MVYGNIRDQKKNHTYQNPSQVSVAGTHETHPYDGSFRPMTAFPPPKLCKNYGFIRSVSMLLYTGAGADFPLDNICFRRHTRQTTGLIPS